MSYPSKLRWSFVLIVVLSQRLAFANEQDGPQSGPVIEGPARTQAAMEARITHLESELAALRELVMQMSNQQRIAVKEESLDFSAGSAPSPVSTATAEWMGDDRGFALEGFIQFDSVFTRYSDGQPSDALIADMLVASEIPVVSGEADSFQSTNLSAKSTRFAFTTDNQTEAGRVTSLLELDFSVSDQGNEKVSNSWSSRLRHAYIDWQWSESDHLVVGQAWTTFMRPQARPALWDLSGSVGQSFNRQPLIRWQHDAWTLAVENPATRLTGVEYSREQRGLPDLVARYDGTAGDLGWSLAGVLRQLNYQQSTDAGDSRKDEATGYAISFAGNWMVGDNDFRFMMNYGDALGRYMGLGAFSDGVVDANGNIQKYDQYGGLVSWSRPVAPRWQAGVALSVAGADLPSTLEYAQEDLLPEWYGSGHFHLEYRPTRRLSFGSEYIHALKELQSGDSGTLDRLMFSMRYNLQ